MCLMYFYFVTVKIHARRNHPVSASFTPNSSQCQCEKVSVQNPGFIYDSLDDITGGRAAQKTIGGRLAGLYDFVTYWIHWMSDT